MQLEIWRHSVGNRDEASRSLHLIICIVKSVAVVHSVEHCAHDLSLVVVKNCELKVVVAFRCDDDVFSVEVGVEFHAHKSDTLENSIIWHVEVVFCKDFIEINETC